MQALRRIVQRKDLASINIPPEFGDYLEVIILPVAEQPADPVSGSAGQFLEFSGFFKSIMSSADEDVWNDVRPDPGVPQDR